MQCRTILCPVEDSGLTDVAVEAAAYMVKISGAKLVLLHVMKKWYSGQDVVSDSKEWNDVHQNWVKEGRDLLTGVAAKVRNMGVEDLDMELRDGEPAHEIVSMAKEKRADLIVMATYHHSPIGKLFTGSVTDRVAKSTPCPILWCFKENEKE